MGLSYTQPASGAPNLVFFDDFSSGHLDRSKWNGRTTGQVVNNEQQAYVDSSETIYIDRVAAGSSNNVLVLHPRYRSGFPTSDGQQFDFISGRVDTRERFQFTYGSVSARMKLPVGAGLWPAFWIMGAGPWPATGEIDVMESVGDPSWVSSAVHGPGYSGEGGLVNKRYFANDEGAADWHVYSVDWEPDQLSFKVDGVTTYRVTRAMIGFFGSWVFDNEKFLILNVALGGTYPFKTNGIHSPYYGLAEATVASIKQDEAKLMIDWVRVDSLGGPTQVGSTNDGRTVTNSSDIPHHAGEE